MTAARPHSDSIGSAAQHFGFDIAAVDRAKFPSLVDGARCSCSVDELHAIDRATYLAKALGKAANSAQLDVTFRRQQ